MRPRDVVLLLALAGACVPTRPALNDPTPIAITAAPRPAPPVDEPMPEPEPPRLGPFRREAPILFLPSEAHATIASVQRNLRAWSGSDDGRARIEVGCRKGVHVLDAAGRRPVAGRAERVAIAPDGHEVALEQGGRIQRSAQPSGSAGPILEGIDAMYLGGANGWALAFHRECKWFVAAPGAPEVALGESCGTPIRGERDRQRLWLAESDGTRTAAIIGLEAGQPPVRVELDAARPMSAPALSPDAAILCGTFVEFGHDVLECRLREGGAFDRVAKDVSGTPVFADDARRMVLTIGEEPHPPRELHLVDFDHRIVRKLGRIAHHRLGFLAGGEHVVAYDGARGLLFELDTGWVTPFGEEADDWVALGPDDRPGSFLASRLRSRCAELVRVEVPRRDAS